MGAIRHERAHDEPIGLGRRANRVKLLDTCFLIHLHREWVSNVQGAATQYLEIHASEEFGISVVAALEFMEGYDQLADAEQFLAPFRQFAVTMEVARAGSRIRRLLRTRGEMIGDFDILIAATALNGGLPLVTDNTRHFERVEGLLVEGYR